MTPSPEVRSGRGMAAGSWLCPRKRKRRRRHNKSRPLRPEFVGLRHNREELLRRRKHYIHEYARILNKLKFRERVVRELLRRPGGVAVVDWHEHRQELEQIREKRQSQGGMLKGKEKLHVCLM